MKKSYTLCYCSFFICMTSHAGILRHDTEVLDYRDFAENLGKYSVGATHIPVYKKDGTLSGYLEFSMPDFGMVINSGYSSLVAPSYLASVRHNTGYTRVNFGNGAQYAATYKLINRNVFDVSGTDFHVPRLNKVVTDATPLETVGKSVIRQNDRSRYSWYARVGGGTQTQISDDQATQISLASAYTWKTGGTINPNAISFTSGGIRYVNYDPDNALTSPLSLGSLSGDSGSPVLVYDEVDRRWKLVGVMRAISGSGYKQTSYVEYIPDGYIESIVAANTSPDVTDAAAGGTILWGADAITQASYSWSWQGLAETYKNTAPSAASNEELDATRDLRFNGDGGLIVLQDAVNMGAGKLQFSSDYTLASSSGVDATWVGGGVEVDAGKTVLWQVNGLTGDALHKIGDGTLHINATGVNAGRLNTGAGTVILDQQADANGNKQAFSSVTLVSGRPTVVLNDASQVSTNNIYFGYRGGILDLNGNALSFKKINHTDSGATLVNHSGDVAASLNLTGYTTADIRLNAWSSTAKGTVGSLYREWNSTLEKNEYFRLKTENYWYYPTDQTSTSTWEYLGTDLDAILDSQLNQLNRQVFRGFIGETDSEKTNGQFDVNVSLAGPSSLMALTGGMNLNGTLNVEQGTVLLSGQPVAHAASVVIDDDWSTSLFVADSITVADGATFQVGEYAGVKARIDAGESSRLMLGYNSSATLAERIWRCYAVIYSDTTTCSQPERSADEREALPASTVTGDITLADNASLYLGKVDYTGAVSSSGATSMTLDSTAYWQMTDNSYVTSLKALSGSTLSMVPAGKWSAKDLQVDSLDATGLTIGLGVNPSTAENDKLTIKNSAIGSGNVLDVSLMLEASQPVSLLEDLVMIDAPEGTAHDYFTLADTVSGFSIYTPNYQVKDEEGRVQWVLQHNQTQEVIPDPEPEVAPDTEQDPEADETDTDSENTQEESTPSEFNPDDWFTVQNNQSLIRDTRALMASRQYIFSEAVSQLNDRSAQLRAAPEKSGAWATIENSKGRWQDYGITQKTLNIGWDVLDDDQIFGVSASYTQGKTQGNGRENHRLASAGISYSWSPSGRWFIDVASRYMYLNQDFSLDPLLGIQGAQRDSHILAGSLKTGYQFRLAADTLSVSPYVGISGGYLSGYRLEGKDAQVSLSSGTPYFATTGLEVKKRGLWNHPDIMLTAGIEYQYSPGNASSEIVLSDRQSDRRYQSWADNRYRAHLGIEGKITDQLTVSAKVKNSFGGTFKTDYNATLGVGYHF